MSVDKRGSDYKIIDLGFKKIVLPPWLVWPSGRASACTLKGLGLNSWGQGV